MSKCIKCGSYAFNLYKEGIDQGGLCDVHYWQGRAHRAEALAEQPAPVQQEPAWRTAGGIPRFKPAPVQEPVAWMPAWDDGEKEEYEKQHWKYFIIEEDDSPQKESAPVLDVQPPKPILSYTVGGKRQ